MKNKKLNIKFRIPEELHKRMLLDLKRPHPFAYERVGFLFAKTVKLSPNVNLVIAIDYLPVGDNDYINDKEVGAKINSNAIRAAMQGVFEKDCGCFHVHLHNHSGRPSPSFTDAKSLPGIVKSLNNIAPKHTNGFLILSRDAFYSSIKTDSISVIGYPFLLQYPIKKTIKDLMFDRQSFLGTNSQSLFENIKVGIIGYGGGGSHIGQQLAHLGVKNLTIFDYDKMEDTNLNRLIGGVYTDIKKAILKVNIAKRVIKRIFPKSNLTLIAKKWQQAPEELQICDIILGGVDSYTERQQLEAECRRFLIPLIDIGMDVYDSGGYSMSGQVILSMPGSACMSCYGFLTEDKLAKEAAKYGNVGGRPQVVWPNGVLASTAVGVFVDLVTGWSGNSDGVYLSYDGNSGKITDHIRKQFTSEKCDHFRIENTGKPNYTKI
ncbi:ThiF family protein [Flavobacterium fluvii]|uniref:ThiF family protein n=1 Tax=Flavobacterium fluvii TaxID=468056 RepID=A0A1M5ERY1_9FLAO|nr:ThiF family adenylyltransferase [Flavobacterium fluvii]SHF82063.1 ThiF family protein [Flavobacterium fluvii]